MAFNPSTPLIPTFTTRRNTAHSTPAPSPLQEIPLADRVDQLTRHVQGVESREKARLEAAAAAPDPLADLKDFFRTLPGHPVPSPNVPREARPTLPAPFNGNPGDCRTFICKIKYLFFVHPHLYPTERQQVGLIVELLTGAAQAWVTPLLETQDDILSDLQEFLHRFSTTFGTVEPRAKAERAIGLLHQTGSIQDYATQFRTITVDLNWDSEALIYTFRRGLRHDVKDLLITLPRSNTLDGVINDASICYDRILDRNLDRRGAGPSSRSPWASPLSKGPPTTPTSLPPQVTQPSLSSPRGPLSETERARRRTAHLCLYCAGAGHLVNTCPNKQSRSGAHVAYVDLTDSGNVPAQVL